MLLVPYIKNRPPNQVDDFFVFSIDAFRLLKGDVMSRSVRKMQNYCHGHSQRISQLSWPEVRLILLGKVPGNHKMLKEALSVASRCYGTELDQAIIAIKNANRHNNSFLKLLNEEFHID